jgi:phospholipid/cholesterol/gamma-HCH transport system substrate-binding protein
MPRRAEPAWGELKLGILVTLVVASAVFGVVIIGSTRGPFAPDVVPYFVELEEAGGIRAGSFVRVAGMPAGEVVELVIVPPLEQPSAVVRGRLQPATGLPSQPANIRLELGVHDRFQPYITPTSRAQLATLGMGGERYVKITAGDVREGPLPAGSTITEIPSVDWDLVTAQLGRALAEVEVLAANVEEIRAKLFDGNATAALLLDTESPLYGSLESLADQSESLLDALDEGEGIVAGVRGDSVLEENLGTIRANVRAIDSLTRDPAHPWRNPEQLIAALTALEADAQDLRSRLESGEGTLGRLLYDEELWIQLRVLQDRFRRTMEAFREDPLGFVNIRLF